MCIKQNSGLLHDVCIDIRFDILVDTEAAWPCLRSQYTTYVNICVEITYRCIIFYGSATAFFVKVKVHVIKESLVSSFITPLFVFRTNILGFNINRFIDREILFKRLKSSKVKIQSSK